MKLIKKCLPLLVIILTSCNTANRKAKHMIQENFEFAQKQYSNMLKANTDPTQIPRTTSKDGSLKTTDIYSWTSGFFAGTLWQLYEYTNHEKWKNEAKKWTHALEPVKYVTNNHDVGFMTYCSYGNGLRLTNNEAYQDILIQAAKSLSTRYNPIVGSIKSWDYRKAWDGKTEWFFPVIIDNMMNLELLFYASKASGDSKYKEIAIKHAETTMKNHYRSNYSSYHVVDYDTISGRVLDKATCQGYTDASAWARGQAWGLYGFSMVYRETKDSKFLEFAENIADYIINHPNLPADKIPLWDFNATNPAFKPQWKPDMSLYTLKERDVSAATIIASAMYELSTFTSSGLRFKIFADKIVESLSSKKYRANIGENNNFILTQNVGSIPHKAEINVPLNYADYYFLEALIRKKALTE